MKLNSLILTTVLAFIILPTCVLGQGIFWDWTYPVTSNYGGRPNACAAGSDGHFYLFGSQSGDYHIWELDEYGRLEQVIDLGLPYNGVWSKAGIVQNHLGGFTLFEPGGPGNNQASVWIFDANWSLQSQGTAPAVGISDPLSNFTRTTDNGYVITGLMSSSPNNRGRMVKLDSMGVMEWDSMHMAHSTYRGFGQVKSTPDGNVVVAISYPVSDSSHIQKRNLQGDLIWEVRERSKGDPQISVDGEGATWHLGMDADSTLLYRLTKIDSSGNVLFSKDIFKPYDVGYRNRITMLSEGGGFIVGAALGTWYDVVIRIDENGNEIWRKQVNHLEQSEFFQIDTTEDRGCFVSGYKHQPTIGTSIPFAYRLDSLGNLAQNHLSGTAFLDKDQDCLLDSDEYTVPNLVVEVQPGNEFALTDALGTYRMNVDSGHLGLSIYSPFVSGILPLCHPGDSIPLYFPNLQDTLGGIDIPITLEDSCPRMQVEITGLSMRVCNISPLHVTYTNISADSITNAHVDVTLDPKLIFQNASLPHTVIGSNQFRFALPTTFPFQQGSFTIQAILDCNTSYNSSVCNTAHIYPDSGCPQVSPLWTGASLAVSGECLPGDSIQFRIENVGTGNMLAPTSFIIVEDDVLRYGGDVQLAMGMDTLIHIQGNGSTWGCFVDQVPNHPFNSIPRVFVEACGQNSGGGYSFGHVTNHQQDDLEPFHSIDCQIARSSCDPNVKIPHPMGTMSEHRISAADQLEYMIRFQNIGNDSAFRVVIQDQLPPELDMGTFAMLSSSHPYSLQFYPDRVVEWTFDPIALVDSVTDPVGSQGFVKFVIQQEPGNVPGTRIENEADIYFDHHGAITTNRTWNTVFESFDELLAVEVDEAVEESGNALEVYPNPVETTLHFRFQAHGYRDLRFELFDLNGRRLRDRRFHRAQAFSVECGDLPSGIFLYRLSSGGKSLSTGRVFVH